MFQIVGKKPHFKQWDLDQLVTCDCLKNGDDVVFRGYGKTYETTAFVQDGQVAADVPNFILQKAGSFQVDLGWGLECHLDCRTTFEVEAREKPEDYVCTENIKQRNISLGSSGTIYLKTINGQSLVGEGDIDIEGEMKSYIDETILGGAW